MPNAIEKTPDMERCLQDMLYEILYGIFRRLSKDKLVATSRLCSRFRDVAGDTRFWKNVYIEYYGAIHETFDFEDFYSEPWPVKTIDFPRYCLINPPASSGTGQVVKVDILDLTSIRANEAAMEAILAKYQCSELYLDQTTDAILMNVAPTTFLKQTALEVLSLRSVWRETQFVNSDTVILPQVHLWLGSVLSNCKNLKSLDLHHNNFTNDEMLVFVTNMPAFLEKLKLTRVNPGPENSFFDLLAESAPNLRDLQLETTTVKCSSLLKFQFLETLRVIPFTYSELLDLNMYLIKFPALKAFLIDQSRLIGQSEPRIELQKFRPVLEPHGISVELYTEPLRSYPEDNNLWTVTRK